MAFGEKAKAWQASTGDTGRSRSGASYDCPLGATLMEILYLSERQRISVDLASLRNLFSRKQSYTVVPVGFEVIGATATIDDIPELHDRVIAGTAVWLNIPILTNDPDITSVLS
jgi:hypothetical protein